MSKWKDALPFRQRIAHYPSIFYPLHALKNKFDCNQLYTASDTELVIEGFPRSANTFSVFAFERAQGRAIKLAHHMHVPIQIVRGVRLGVPTIVLLREPQDAVLSLMVRYPSLSVISCVKTYIDFYSSIFSLRDQFVIGEFSRVTSNFGYIIKKVNQKFGTNFIEPEDGEANRQAVFADIKKHHLSLNGALNHLAIAIPLDARNTAKEELSARFNDSRVNVLMEEARNWYLKFVGEIDS